MDGCWIELKNNKKQPNINVTILKCNQKIKKESIIYFDSAVVFVGVETGLSEDGENDMNEWKDCLPETNGVLLFGEVRTGVEWWRGENVELEYRVVGDCNESQYCNDEFVDQTGGTFWVVPTGETEGTTRHCSALNTVVWLSE